MNIDIKICFLRLLTCYFLFVLPIKSYADKLILKVNKNISHLELFKKERLFRDYFYW